MTTGNLSAFVQGAQEKHLEVVIGVLSPLGRKRQKLAFSKFGLLSSHLVVFVFSVRDYGLLCFCFSKMLNMPQFKLQAQCVFKKRLFELTTLKYRTPHPQGHFAVCDCELLVVNRRVVPNVN